MSREFPFSVVEAPTPSVVPLWMGGLHINWMLGYINSPVLHWKKVAPLPVESALWKFDEGRCLYWRELDGLAERLYHGPANIQKEDGWHTPVRDGFGGRRFTIQMEDGRTVHLNGPWYGGTTHDGWSETVMVDATEPDPYGRPWQARTGSFGFFMHEELVKFGIAHFRPDLGIARVEYPWFQCVEPFRLEWGTVKNNLTDAQVKTALELQRTEAL